MSQEKTTSYLYNPLNYNPDTLDLIKDTDARSYWFDCFKNLASKFATQAAKSEWEDPTSINRAKEFENNYIDILNTLKTDTERYEKIHLLNTNKINYRLISYINYKRCTVSISID